MKIIRNEFKDLWEEKYRPQCLDDIILPEKLQSQLKKYVENKNIPNILFVSSVPGTGKTSVIHCLLNELDADYKWINASENNNVSTIRNDIVNFASTMSANAKKKILVLDEADNLTTSSGAGAGAQDILRGVIEQYALNTRFFLTGNYKERFIEPLMSRFKVLDFDSIFTKNKRELAKKMYERLMFICNNENIEYNKKDLQIIVKEHYPSMRNMVIALQNNIFDNKLELQNTAVDDEYKNIMELVKLKKWAEVRSNVMLLNNISSFYSWLWKNLEEYFPGQLHPEIVIDLARYQEMDRIANNKEITLMAFLTKLISKI